MYYRRYMFCGIIGLTKVIFNVPALKRKSTGQLIGERGMNSGTVFLKGNARFPREQTQVALMLSGY
jgi:hypothetical protein